MFPQLYLMYLKLQRTQRPPVYLPSRKRPNASKVPKSFIKNPRRELTSTGIYANNQELQYGVDEIRPA